VSREPSSRGAQLAEQGHKLALELADSDTIRGQHPADVVTICLVAVGHVIGVSFRGQPKRDEFLERAAELLKKIVRDGWDKRHGH